MSPFRPGSIVTARRPRLAWRRIASLFGSMLK